MGAKTFFKNLINKVVKGKNFCNKGNNLNLVLSFNFYKNIAQISSVLGTDLTTLNVSEYKFKNGVLTEQFVPELLECLTKLVAQYGATNVKSVRIILPDEAVFLDAISLPQINGKGQNRALFSVMEKDYKNTSQICSKFALISKNKNNANFIIASINNQIKTTILGALKSVNLNCESLTFSANSAVNFALKINPELKKKSVLLIEDGADFITFIAIINGRAVGVYKTENCINEVGKEQILLKICNFAQNFCPIGNQENIKEVAVCTSSNLQNYLVNNCNYLQTFILDCQEFAFTKNLALLGAIYCAKSNEEFNFI